MASQTSLPLLAQILGRYIAVADGGLEDDALLCAVFPVWIGAEYLWIGLTEGFCQPGWQ